MRTKTIKRKAYVFDFDETLVKTTAKVHVIKNGKRYKSITPEEFNHYKKEEDEKYDMSDFIDPRIILNATKYKMWPALENIHNANKFGKSDSVIYILTARSDAAQIPIHNLFKRHSIDIPIDNIITIGSDDGLWIDIPTEKEKVLTALVTMYDVYFFDDSEDNIELANKIPGVKTRLIDWKK